MKRFTFAVGITQGHRITVSAETLDDADLKARDKLDAIAERMGDEAPVRWDLTLLEERTPSDRG